MIVTTVMTGSIAGTTGIGSVYATTFLIPATAPLAALVPLALLGAYYAATDGVLTAMAASALSPATTGSGLSLLATATSLSRLLSSVAFGLMWSAMGIGQATLVFGVALVAALAGARILLGRGEPSTVLVHE